MRAVIAREPGGPEVLEVQEVTDPAPGAGEVVIEIVAAGLNRADLLQRQGFYPPPPGASDIIGMECSGRISAVGEDVDGWQVGDEVCALLAGGGYATTVAVPAGQVMHVPAGVDLVEAAALPEVACTVWSNIVMHAGLEQGDLFLVHGGAGGIGSFAIQLASALGARVITTVGSADKATYAQSLGAERAINYREEDFVEIAQGLGGADVILDNMGAKYLMRNVEALADGGRLAIIGLQGGAKAELDINALMRKRAAVIGTTLRSRPTDGPRGKAAICAEVVEYVWPLIESGRVKEQVSRTFPLAEAAEAHRHMESGDHTGKLLLTT
ncbi:NAD(P)H-quinone oxidoreductase [Nocardioides sp. Kera G14]|uniref:NAD(P)H-quinone oxidoreductase n=1 Tax=Nocardioides sp. Kera G14 TaxID=2884264 RepID=UPI001D1031EB|nr:NAD(P)H-quinone oxidoreductase [Nocardioides sp. Kera G14]UDY23343.1 NAD(P)H-quinone oxidoreductase [Nocardioides sp. Kera G14]